MKAVTIRQPEVTRLAAGETRVEVKTWRTDYRGDILLVSALTPWIEPAGYAIAVGRLVDCRAMAKRDEVNAGKRLYQNAQAWVLAEVRPIRIFSVRPGRNVFDVPMPSGGIQRIARVALTPAMSWSLKDRVAPTRARAPTEQPVPLGPKHQKQSVTDANRLDILIVDGDPLLARGVQRCILAEHGVRFAPSCSKALAAVKARLPDVVICDFQLAGESNEPFLRALATNHPNVRRILYSSSHRDIWTRTIDRALINGVVTKPATRQQLLAVIAA